MAGIFYGEHFFVVELMIYFLSNIFENLRVATDGLGNRWLILKADPARTKLLSPLDFEFGPTDFVFIVFENMFCFA